MRKKGIVPAEIIEQKIFYIRGQKVMLDKDLAILYQVKPIALRQQVKRNKKRFPNDFMFQLTKKEVTLLVSQFVIPSKRNLGGYLPYAFTEQGIAMLSSILNSERAILINIQIMRTFTRLRKILATHTQLRKKIEKIEKTMKITNKHNHNQFQIVFDILKQILKPPVKPKRKIGFIQDKQN